MGIGDWGLGIGDWGLGIGPNPHQNLFKIILKLFFIKYFKKIFFKKNESYFKKGLYLRKKL